MRLKMIAWSIGLMAFYVVLSSCDGSKSDEVDPFSCDPYEQNTIPIELVSVLIVGQDTAGTIYLVDEHGEDEGFRVFLSEGNTLVRQEIGGSGIGHINGLGDYYLFIMGYGEDEYTLVIEITEEGNAQMARVPGNYKGTIHEMGDDGQLLTVLNPSSIEEMSIQNFPGVIETEYVSTVANGNSIVVTRPRNDWDYEDFRLFYGKENHMEERRILEVLRANDGGSTWIDFVLGSDEVQVYFGYENMEWGEAYLEIDSERIPVTRLHPEQEDLTRFSFFCIQ